MCYYFKRPLPIDSQRAERKSIVLRPSASPCTILWGLELPGRRTVAALGALSPSQRSAGEVGACFSLAKSEHLKVLASEYARGYESGQEVKSKQDGAFIYLFFPPQFLVLNLLPRIKGF